MVNLKKIKAKNLIEINPYENMETFIFPEKGKNPILEVQNISQWFHKLNSKINVFNNISFKLFKGESLAFLGPNGSGKTTMMSTICGIYKHKEGDIKFNFEYDKTPYERMSIQFQDLQFPTCLTPRDLIEFSLEISKQQIEDDELLKALEIFEVDKIVNEKMSKLSGGQQQRINVLIAMITKPEILILDEFTTGLDIAIKNKIQEYIKYFCKKYNISLILISHDLDTIEELCDRVIILADKKIMVNAPRKEIVKKFGSITKMLKKYIVV